MLTWLHESSCRLSCVWRLQSPDSVRSGGGRRRPNELLCHCQFVELSPRAVEEFYAAADLVTARSAAKVGPEFGVCRRAELALQKLSLRGCSKRFDWPPVVATSEKPASVSCRGVSFRF